MSKEPTTFENLFDKMFGDLIPPEMPKFEIKLDGIKFDPERIRLLNIGLPGQQQAEANRRAVEEHARLGHDDWDAGGHCNAMVTDDEGYGKVCGYVLPSATRGGIRWGITSEKEKEMDEDYENELVAAEEANAEYAATRKALKKVIRKVKGSKIADGTVLKWVSGGRFNYVGIYVAAMNAWFVSGEGRFYGGNVISNDDFAGSVLKTADEVFIATGWDKLS